MDRFKIMNPKKKTLIAWMEVHGRGEVGRPVWLGELRHLVTEVLGEMSVPKTCSERKQDGSGMRLRAAQLCPERQWQVMG